MMAHIFIYIIDIQYTIYNIPPINNIRKDIGKIVKTIQSATGLKGLNVFYLHIKKSFESSKDYYDDDQCPIDGVVVRELWVVCDTVAYHSLVVNNNAGILK